SIDGAGTCTDNACGSEKAGDYTVTGTDGTFTDTASLKVDATELASIQISPKNAEIPAGGTQVYSAEGFDAHGNDLGDVTTGTVFSIDGTGTCTDNACGSEKAGDYTVTGTDGTFTDTASLKVDATALASITIAPKTAEINAGGTQLYTAEGFDAHGNDLGDVTTGTVFSIDGTGTCTDNACGSEKAGDYTVTGTDGTFTDTASLKVDAGAANKLAFSVQPSNTTSGTQISPAVKVEVRDANGNLVNSAVSVTLAIGTNPASGTLSGTKTVAAVNGVATFSNLSIDKVGSGYTLAASSAGLAGDTSSTFNITAGAANKLAFSVQPSNTAIGNAITPAVKVEVRDANGNLVN